MNTNPIAFAARAFRSARPSRRPRRPVRWSGRRLFSAWCVLSAILCLPFSALAATFPGNAHIETAADGGALSWATNGSLQCWFKLADLPSLDANMSIVFNKRSTGGGFYAYHLYYNHSRNSIEFRTWGRNAGGRACQFTIINKPYQERWYHVAVVRANNEFTAYVDGRLTLTTNVNVGDSSSNQGMMIGGADAISGHREFYGEIQEVSIYQTPLSKAFIVDNMYRDQPTNTPTLKGYFKLGFSQNPEDRLKNLASTAASGTDGQRQGAGTITYEETDEAGEQSSFDARRNGGAGAIAPLSGSFAWQQTALARPTPGIPFAFQIGYGSVNASGGFKLGSSDPFAPGPLGNGWHHSFETRLLPAEEFAPLADADVVGVMMWNGGIETWDRDLPGNTYSARRGEYRGELTATSTNFQWITPDRLIYTFRRPDSGDAVMRGRLISIRDYNNNELRLEYDEAVGMLTNIVDTAGGQFALHYNGNLLGSVSFDDWQVQFGYDGNNHLISKTLTNTSGLYTNVNTTLHFQYYTSGTSSNLLRAIIDARGNTNVLVVYDEFRRKTNIVNALMQTNRLQYGFPGKRQITTTDPEGYQWVETFDRKSRTIARKNPLGQESRFAYDSRGNRVSIRDPMGNLMLFDYDDRANVVAQTNALGEIARWTYHSFFNKPITQTDPLGWVTTNTYDADGNLLSQRDALGTLATYTYTGQGLVRTATDANGNTARFGYNTSGFRIAETNAANYAKHYLVNDVGWKMAVTNALGEVTTYAYDLNGKTVRTQDALGRVYTGTYDANGNLLTQTDAKGQQARYTYDVLNRRLTEVNRAGATNWFAYTARGKKAAATNALGQVTTIRYDSANRPTTHIDTLGNSQTTVYDANGNAIANIDELGQRWTRTYDALNRPVAVADPFGYTRRTLYDAAGRERQVIAPDGTSVSQAYDGRGRMIQRTDAAGSVWRYDYDGVGNITNITDAMGGRYEMGYGPRNGRIFERNQDGKEWHYTYDALERLKSQTDPNGTVRSVEYDAGSRTLSVAFSTGRVNSFGYDDNDNPIVLSRSGSGPATITQVAYDALDRVSEVTDAFSKQVQYDYDQAGRLTAVTYPDGKVLTNRYDALDRLTNQVFQFSAQQAFTNTYAYDQAGRLVRRVYPNGIVQTNSFDTAGRLTGLFHAPPSLQPSNLNIALSYNYDRNGNTVGRREQGTFQWPMPALRQETARYTPAARLIDRQIAANAEQFTLDYHYDENGNMTNATGHGQSWSLTYDEDNLTTSIHWDSGVTAKTIDNRYDALGRRIARTVDGTQTGYVLDLAGDMERILCDLNASRVITAWYVYGPDLVFKVAPDGTLTCYHPDAQGNIIALTDGQADTTAEYAYTPYGRSLGSTSSDSSQPYRFVGSQGVMNELPGLYFMRARYYLADAGVFLSTDPVKNIGPTWMPVAYAYGEQNPLRFNDPDGRFWNFIIGAAVGFVSDIVVQTVIEGKSFKEINWAEAGISAAVGALTGGVGGLTSGIGTATALSAAERVLQVGLRVGVYAVNMAVGAGTTVLAQAANNAAQGEGFNLKGLSGADVLVGGLMGGVGLGGAKGGASRAGGAPLRSVLGRAGKWLESGTTKAKRWFVDEVYPGFSKMGPRETLMWLTGKSAARVQSALHAASWAGGETALFGIQYGLSEAFGRIPNFGNQNGGGGD